MEDANFVQLGFLFRRLCTPLVFFVITRTGFTRDSFFSFLTHGETRLIPYTYITNGFMHETLLRKSIIVSAWTSWYLKLLCRYHLTHVLTSFPARNAFHPSMVKNMEHVMISGLFLPYKESVI